MDTWATSSLTPADRRPAGTTTPTCSSARSRWTCARRATRSSAPGCSPPSCARTSSTARCRGPTRRSRLGARPRPQEDVEVEGQRRHADAARSSSTAPTRVRYWAASGRPGIDTAVDDGQMKVGRRLAIKILNASKFALGVDGRRRRTDVRRGHRAARPVDARRRSPTLVDDATAAFDGYDYARALERTERFFWAFCDDYLELVKGRAYGDVGDDGAASAAAALALALVDAAAAVRAVPAVRHRRGVVVVARRARCTARRGRRPTSSRARRRRPRVSTRSRPTVLGEMRKAKTRARSARCAPRSTAVVVHDTAERLRRARARAERRARGRARSSATSSSADGDRARGRGRARRPRRRDARCPSRDGPGLARRPRQPRDAASACRRRRASGGGAARSSASARCCELLGSPAARVPGGPLTGTNGKTSTARMIAALLLDASGSRSAPYTSPHLERVNERMRLERRADRRRRARRACSSRWPTVEDRAPRRAQLLRDPHRGRAARGSPTSRSTSRSSRSGSAAPGTPPTSSTADVAVVTNVSIDHVEYLGPTRARDRGGEGGDRRSPASTLVLGETDPELVPIFIDARPGAVVRARRRLRRARATCSRSAAGSLDLYTPDASLRRRVPRRCTARTRPTTPRSRSPRRRRSSARALDADARRATRSRAVRSPGRLEVVGRHPLVLLDGAHNVAGARRVARRARRGVRRLGRARSSSGCCARRSRTRCSTALGVDDVDAARVLPPAEPARARPDVVAERRASSSASTARSDRGRRRRAPTR